MKLVTLLLLTLLGLAPVTSHKCVEKMHRRSGISKILQVCGWNSVREWIVDFRKAIVLKISHNKEGVDLDPANFEYLSAPMNYYLDLMNQWHYTRQIYSARLLVTAFGPNCRPFLSLPTLLQSPFLNAYMKEADLTFDGTENYGILCPDALYFVRTISDGDILRPLKIKIHKLPLEEESEYNQFVELHMKMNRRLALKQKKFSKEEIISFSNFKIEPNAVVEGGVFGTSDLKETEANEADKAFFGSSFEDYIRKKSDDTQNLNNIGGTLDTQSSDQNSSPNFDFVAPSQMPAPKLTLGEVRKNQKIFMNEEIELLKKKRTLKEFFTYREGFRKGKGKHDFRLKDKLNWEFTVSHYDFLGEEMLSKEIINKVKERLDRNIDQSHENRMSLDYKNFYNTIRNKSDFDKGYFMKPDQIDHTMTGDAYKFNNKNLQDIEIIINYQRAFNDNIPKHYSEWGMDFDDIKKINPHLETDFWTRLQSECDALEAIEDDVTKIDPNFPTENEFIKDEFYDFADNRADSDLLKMLSENTENLPVPQDSDDDVVLAPKPNNIFKQQAEDIIKQGQIDGHNFDKGLGPLHSMGVWKNIQASVVELHTRKDDRRIENQIFRDQDDISEHGTSLVTANNFLIKMNDNIITHISSKKWNHENTIGQEIIHQIESRGNIDTNFIDLSVPENIEHTSMNQYEQERVDPALLSDEMEMHTMSTASKYEIFDRERRYSRLNKPNKFYIRIKRDLNADVRALGEVGDAIASVMSLGSNQFCNGQSLEHCAGIQIFPDVIPLAQLNQYTEQSLDEIFNESTMFNNYLSAQVLRLCVFSQVHYMRLEKFVDYSIKRKELVSLCYRSTQRTLATFNENHLQSSTFPRRWIVKNPYNTSAAKKALQKGMIDFEALKKVFQDEDDQLKLNSRVKIESLMNKSKRKEYQNEQNKIDDQIVKKQMDLLKGEGEKNVENRLALQRIKIRQEMMVMDTGYEEDRVQIERHHKLGKEKLRSRIKKLMKKRDDRPKMPLPNFSGVPPLLPDTDSNSTDDDRIHVESPHSSSDSDTVLGSDESRYGKVQRNISRSQTKRKHLGRKRHRKSKFNDDGYDSGYDNDSPRGYVEDHRGFFEQPDDMRAPLDSERNFDMVMSHENKRHQQKILESAIHNRRGQVHWHAGVSQSDGHHGGHARTNTIIPDNFLAVAGIQFMNDQQVRKEKAVEFRKYKERPKRKNLDPNTKQKEDKNWINKGRYKFVPLEEALTNLRKVPNTKLIFRDGKLYRVPINSVEMDVHQSVVLGDNSSLVIHPPQNSLASTPKQIGSHTIVVGSGMMEMDVDMDMGGMHSAPHSSVHSDSDTDTTSAHSASAPEGPTHLHVDLDEDMQSLIQQIEKYYEHDPLQNKRLEKRLKKGHKKKPYLVINQPINEYDNRSGVHLGQLSQVNPGDEELLNRSDVMMDLLKDNRAVNMFDVALEKGVFTQDEDEDNIPISDIFKEVYNEDFQHLNESRTEDKLLKDKDFTQADPDMVQTMYNLARQTEYSDNINHLLKFFADYDDYEECMENVQNPEFLLEHSLNRNPYNNWVLRKDGVVYQGYDEMFFIPDNYELTHRPMKEWLFFPFAAICNGMLNHSFVTLGAIQQVSRNIAPNFEVLNFRVRINEIENLKDDFLYNYLFEPNSLVRKDVDGVNQPKHERIRSVFLHDQSQMVEIGGIEKLAKLNIKGHPDLDIRKFKYRPPTAYAFDKDIPSSERSIVVSVSEHDIRDQPKAPLPSQVGKDVSIHPPTSRSSSTNSSMLMPIPSVHPSHLTVITIKHDGLDIPVSRRSHGSHRSHVSFNLTVNTELGVDRDDDRPSVRFNGNIGKVGHSRGKSTVFLGMPETDSSLQEQHILNLGQLADLADESMLFDDNSDTLSSELHDPYVRGIFDNRYTSGECKFLSDFECAAIYFNKLKEKAKGGESKEDKVVAHAAQRRIDLLQKSLQIGNCDSIAESAFENFGIMMIRIAEHSQKFGAGEELVVNEPLVLDIISKFLPRSIEAFFERHCISITMSKMEGILNREEPNFARIKESPFRKLGRVFLSRSKVEDPKLMQMATHFDFDGLVQQPSPTTSDYDDALRVKILDSMQEGFKATLFSQILDSTHDSKLLTTTGLGIDQDNIILFNHFFPDFTVTSFMNRAISFYQDISMYFFRNMDIGDLEDGVQD